MYTYILVVIFTFIFKKNVKYFKRGEVEMQDAPMVSVLMPVYNGERWLDTAIRSILLQTYSNFELLILLEYGSNKKSREIVYGYNDRRIRVIENREKLGLAASLNVGINEARGKYIARMDADDVSFRSRFKIQVAFLEKHSDIAICGTDVKLNWIVIRHRPSNFAELRFLSFMECVFAHPTVMWRKDLFIKKNLFYKEKIEAEDFEFWTRVLDQYNGVNIRKPLLMYRLSEESKSFVNKEVLDEENDEILEQYWYRNGMRYYPPKGFERFQNSKVRYQEWRLIELTRKTEEFKRKNNIIRKKFFDFYANDTFKVRVVVKRYNNLFLDRYRNHHLAKFQIYCYAVFRNIKRLILPILLQILRRL